MKIQLTLALSLCCLFSFSQPKESFYVLDSNWKQTVLDSATYLFWIHKNEDGNWIHSYYHMWGPMIKMETYKDRDGRVLDGLSCYYYKNGDLDSVGHYQDGKKEGSFYKYSFSPHDSLRIAMQYKYTHDSLIGVVDYDQDTLSKKDREDTAGDRESEYVGGIAQWQRFLGKNLHYPDRAVNKEIQGEVRVLFMVDEEGNVTEPFLSRSVEYSLDRESLRMIRLSGKWEPGLKHGEPAKTYKVQPIRFALEAQ
jgi:protein TonB